MPYDSPKYFPELNFDSLVQWARNLAAEYHSIQSIVLYRKPFGYGRKVIQYQGVQAISLGVFKSEKKYLVFFAFQESLLNDDYQKAFRSVIGFGPDEIKTGLFDGWETIYTNGAPCRSFSEFELIIDLPQNADDQYKWVLFKKDNREMDQRPKKPTKSIMWECFRSLLDRGMLFNSYDEYLDHPEMNKALRGCRLSPRVEKRYLAEYVKKNKIAGEFTKSGVRPRKGKKAP